MASPPFDVTLAIAHEREFEQTLHRAVDDQVASRIADQDPTLWGEAAESEAKKRLAWTSLATTSRPLVEEIATLRAELTERELDHVVLCGMGGSSLAPEVICATAGVELTVLDSSQPDMVRRALNDRLERSVVVVSSKSGGTVETDSLKRAYEQAFIAAGLDPARHIVVVTDPDSPLDQEATEAGYRVFRADPNVGGRYSALTAFGLVPAGLAGAPIDQLLDEAEAVQPTVAADNGDNPALRLGVALGVANQHGVDKLVLADQTRHGLGDWIEQLVAESTGKLGKGILPVVVPFENAVNFNPSTADTVLVALGSSDAPEAQSGWSAGVRGGLGAQMLVWETAVAVAGQLLGINPFDQPDVESAKQAARDLLGHGSDTEQPDLESQGVAAYGTNASDLEDGRRRPARRARPVPRLRVRPGLPRPHRPGRVRRPPRGAGPTHRTSGHVRLGAAVPALHRAVPQGRAGHRRLPPAHVRPGRRPPGGRPRLHLRRVHRFPGRRRRPGPPPARASRAEAASLGR